MIAIIRSEWIKFRSVRSNVLLVLAAGLVVVLVAFFAAAAPSGTPIGSSARAHRRRSKEGRWRPMERRRRQPVPTVPPTKRCRPPSKAKSHRLIPRRALDSSGRGRTSVT
ncbi:MAG: hypothetical protein ACR2MB_17285 [Acidimicrobiales bacterium]